MISEDVAVSDSAEHKCNLRKQERKARGLITGSISDLLKFELDELKGNEVTTTTSTGEDTVTVISYLEPSTQQLWEHLKACLQKKDGTSAIFDPQQLARTRFHNNNTLENQLTAMQVLCSRCTLNDFDLSDWQYATTILLTLPSTLTYKVIKDYYPNNIKPKKLSPNAIRVWVVET